MVTKFGMSDKIGYIGYIENEYKNNYSDKTHEVIILYFI